MNWEEVREHREAVKRNVKAEEERASRWNGQGSCPTCHGSRFVAAGNHSQRCHTCKNH